MNQKAKAGQTVKVHYSVRKENTLYGSSKDGQPIRFKIGSGDVISGMESGAIGMEAGEVKTITVPPEEAFGSVRNNLVRTVKKYKLPERFDPAIGKILRLKRPSGKVQRWKVTDITDDTVTLDANHPLAGQTINLDLEMVEILDN
jgi:FKBP-type peptidyl-prolyl cis-trans isomerase 2